MGCVRSLPAMERKQRPVVRGRYQAALLTRRAVAPEGKQSTHPIVPSSHSGAAYVACAEATADGVA